MFPLSNWKCFLLGMPSTKHKTVKRPSNNPKFLSFFGMYHYLPKWRAHSPTVKLPLGKLFNKTPFLSVFRNCLIKRKLFILKSISYFLQKNKTKLQGSTAWTRGTSHCPRPWKTNSSSQHTANAHVPEWNGVMILAGRSISSETVPRTWAVGTSLTLLSKNEMQHGFTFL